MGVYTDEDLDELVRANIKLTKENNKLLHKLWRAELFGFWTRILFIAVLIGVPVILYQYVLSDYVDQARTTFEELREDFTNLKTLPEKLTPAAVIEAVSWRDEQVE